MDKNYIKQNLFSVILLLSVIGVCHAGAPIAVITDADGNDIDIRYALVGEWIDFYGDQSYDTDEANEYIADWHWRSYWRDHEPDHYVVDVEDPCHYRACWDRPGTFRQWLRVLDDESVEGWDYCLVSVQDLLSVDTNRDGSITSADDEDEEGPWSHGPSGKGAIVLPNCDDDYSGETADGVPDNWPGDNNPYYTGDYARDWDLDGNSEQWEAANQIIDGGDDIDDIAELWFHQIPAGSYNDTRVTITVTNESSDPFFSAVADNDIIRIFLPDEGDTEVEAGDSAIIGPEDSASVTYDGDDDELDFFIGTGILKLGVEGIEFGADVNIAVTVYRQESQGGPYEPNGTDTVRMRVAPFVLSDHRMSIDTSPPHDGKSVFVTDDSYLGYSTSDLQSKLWDEYGSCRDVATDDPWHQDGYEVGYAKAPYGEMPVFLVTPRAIDRPDVGPVLGGYVHNNRLGPNVGVCWRLEEFEFDTNDYESFCCGNIESRPSTSSKPGELFCGENLDANVDSFFAAQNENDSLSIDTGWLAVGHVDEVVSFASTTFAQSTDETVFVADPDLCWALMIAAYWHSPSSDMLEGDDEDSVSNQLGKTITVGQNSVHIREYNLETVASAALDDIRNDELNLLSPVTIEPENGKLLKAGAFIGFFWPDRETIRKYRVKFLTGGVKYKLQYKDSQDTWQDLPMSRCYGMTYDAQTYAPTGYSGDVNDNFISRNHDCVFIDVFQDDESNGSEEDVECFIFKNYWDPNATYLADDTVEFEVDPQCRTVEIPVLFRYDEWNFGGAVAYTVDNVNCIIDPGIVFTGKAHGPPLGEPVTINNGEYYYSDILASYVHWQFDDHGLTPEPDSESWYYHINLGDIHCGTNVIREVPTYKWWETTP